jgi:Ca2+-binding EF-hand superfamily protein
MKLIKISVLALCFLAFTQVNAQDKKQNKGKKGPDSTFAKLDTNEDGKLSLDEFKAFAPKTKDGEAREIDHAKALKRKDTNADGFIDLEEFKARPEKKK